MAKKKLSEKPSNRIEIKNKQTPGKTKTSLFANIQHRHPLEDLYNPKTDDNSGAGVAAIVTPSLPQTTRDDLPKEGAHDADNKDANIAASEASQVLQFSRAASDNESTEVAATVVSRLSQRTRAGGGSEGAKVTETDASKLPQPTREDFDKQSANAPKAKKSGEKSSANAPRLQQPTRADSGKNSEFAFERETERLNIWISRSLEQKVREYVASQPKGSTLRDFTEKAFNHYFEFLDTTIAGNDGANALMMSDGLMNLYKTDRRIINLYLRYNFEFNDAARRSRRDWKPNWTMTDDAEGVKFNDFDIKIVEIGIIQTHQNKKFGEGKIFSFKYYAEQIENAVEYLSLGDDVVKKVLDQHRHGWQKYSKRTIDYKALDEALKKEK